MEGQAKIILKESSISVIKSLIGNVPYIGSALDEVLFEARSRIKTNRIHNFIESFIDEIKDINEDDIKRYQFQTDEFSDFLETLLIKVAHTNSQKKTKVFRNLFKQQLTDPLEYDYAETILNVIGSMQEKQIPILILLSKGNASSDVIMIKVLEKDVDDIKAKYPEHSHKSSSEITQKNTQIINLKRKISDNFTKDYGVMNTHYSDYFYLVQSLCNLGLLYEDTSYDDTPYADVKFTNLGKVLIKYLENY